MLEKLCPPSLVYLGFTLVYIIIDVTKNLYNTAMIKFIIMILFTIILNFLCKNGFIITSWIIVFIPFIVMTIFTSLLLYALGLSPNKGMIYANDHSIEHNKYN